MMTRNSFLMRNSVLFAVSTGTTKLISFFMVSFYTRVLTTGDYGVIDIVYTTANILFPIMSLSIYNSVLRYTMDRDIEKREVFLNGFAVTIAGLAIGAFAVPLLGTFILEGKYSWQIYCLVMLHCLYSLCSEYSRGTGQTKKFVYGNIIFAFSSAITSLFLLGLLRLGVSGYIYSTMLGYCAGVLYLAISNRVFVFFGLGVMKLNRKLMKDMIIYGSLLIPNTLSWLLINSFDRYTIMYYFGKSLTGILAVSYRMPVLMTATSLIFVQAWQLSAIREYGSASGEKYTSTVYSRLWTIVIVMNSFIIVFLKALLNIYVSEEYFIAWQPGLFLVVAASFTIMASFLGTSYVAAKKNLGNMLSTLIGACANIIMNIALVPILGLIGAAIATCVSHLIVLIYRMIDTKKFVRVDLINIGILCSLVIIAIQVYVVFFSSKLISPLNLALFVLVVIINKNNIIGLLRFLITWIKRVKK